MLTSAFTVNAVGAQRGTSASSQTVAIPVNSAGALPNYVLITCTTASHFRLGPASVSVGLDDTLINAGNGVIVATCRATTMAFIADTTAGAIQISPLEDL